MKMKFYCAGVKIFSSDNEHERRDTLCISSEDEEVLQERIKPEQVIKFEKL